jgi:uncharacterized DUF497 family protein
MEFEWDETKNQANIAKHGFPFTVAPYILSAPHYLKSSDRGDEERWVAVGPFEQRFVAVVFTVRRDCYRIISIRRARHVEEKDYDSIHER